MLTDVAVRRLVPKEKRYSVLDSEGLYIEVLPGGGKYWRIRKTIKGKEIRRSLGKYPKVPLREARRLRDDMADELEKNGPRGKQATTFAAVAEEWLNLMEATRTPGHVRTVVSRLDRLILPYIGEMPTNEITASDLLYLAKSQEAAGKIETAHRIRQICGQVMRYAVATGRAERDPSADLRGALISKNPEHYPTLTDPDKIGAFLRALDNLNGSPIIKCAVQFQVLTFVRPGELRRADWSEFSGDGKTWKIPPERMKMRRPHIIPLSRQAMKLLDDLRPLTGNKSQFLFPAVRDFKRPMSDMTVNAALRRLGYTQNELTGHGFRSMASTILNENGWPVDAIERQLAHVERNAIRAAYNHAEYLDTRRDMMQWWADWLDGVKEGNAKPFGGGR